MTDNNDRNNMNHPFTFQAVIYRSPAIDDVNMSKLHNDAGFGGILGVKRKVWV